MFRPLSPYSAPRLTRAKTLATDVGPRSHNSRSEGPGSSHPIFSANTAKMAARPRKRCGHAHDEFHANGARASQASYGVGLPYACLLTTVRRFSEISDAIQGSRLSQGRGLARRPSSWRGVPSASDRRRYRRRRQEPGRRDRPGFITPTADPTISPDRFRMLRAWSTQARLP